MMIWTMENYANIHIKSNAHKFLWNTPSMTYVKSLTVMTCKDREGQTVDEFWPTPKI